MERLVPHYWEHMQPIVSQRAMLHQISYLQMVDVVADCIHKAFTLSLTMKFGEYDSRLHTVEGRCIASIFWHDEKGQGHMNFEFQKMPQNPEKAVFVLATSVFVGITNEDENLLEHLQYEVETDARGFKTTRNEIQEILGNVVDVQCISPESGLKDGHVGHVLENDLADQTDQADMRSQAAQMEPTARTEQLG